MVHGIYLRVMIFTRKNVTLIIIIFCEILFVLIKWPPQSEYKILEEPLLRDTGLLMF